MPVSLFVSQQTIFINFDIFLLKIRRIIFLRYFKNFPLSTCIDITYIAFLIRAKTF